MSRTDLSTISANLNGLLAIAISILSSKLEELVGNSMGISRADKAKISRDVSMGKFRGDRGDADTVDSVPHMICACPNRGRVGTKI
jgi:hypothetical protein